MRGAYIDRIMSISILIALLVLSFLILKPILLSVIVGLILAFVFTPVYKWVYKMTKQKSLSSFLICILLIVLVVIPFWFLAPVFIDQSVRLYQASQQIDLVTPFRLIFPSLFVSDQIPLVLEGVISSFTTNVVNSIGDYISIDNLTKIFLHLLVVFFTFFFALRDRKELSAYIKSLLPFSDDIQKKLFDSSKAITSSVIYGQIVIGLLQGIVVGIGFFIFRVPNSLFLTLLASLAGIFPIIGTSLIWVPVVIYLLIAGNTAPALGVTIFGIISSSLDNFLRPIIVSKRTQVHSALILIGMIGGLFLFGILGFIIGPLILAYLLIILEIYRNKPVFFSNK